MHSDLRTQPSRLNGPDAISKRMSGRAETQQRRSGFTLVELMGVIVILGLLASVITVSVRRYMITSRQNIARLEISKICQAVESFYVEKASVEP